MDAAIEAMLEWWPVAVIVLTVLYTIKVVIDVIRAPKDDKSAVALALAPLICTLGFFAIWEVLDRVSGIAVFILPGPSEIGAAIWQFRRQLGFHSFHTAWMTLAASVWLWPSVSCSASCSARAASSTRASTRSSSASTRSRRSRSCRSSSSGSGSAGSPRS